MYSTQYDVQFITITNNICSCHEHSLYCM